MNDLALLVDLHKYNQRQGPGGEKETLQAIRLAGLDPALPLHIADIGCGTGASSLILARHLNAHITAVDLFPDFLDILADRARKQGAENTITPLRGNMNALPFEDQSLDVIWSEGAIYNMGFEQGVTQWRRYLKPGGTLVVSEITWITSTRPAAIQDHWQQEYPQIDTASGKFRVLENCGYSPSGYFVPPEHCWLENYYYPLKAQLPDFLVRHHNSTQANAIVEAEKNEIGMYEKYKSHYSYGFYIARKYG